MAPAPRNPSREDSRAGSGWPVVFLRRADQLVVAALTAAGLVATMAWWFGQGGVIDLEEPLPSPELRYQVDINAADWPELSQLPGIGRTLAERIVADRRQRGPFRDHDDLVRVRGIGPRTLDRIRPYLLPMPDRDTVAHR